MSDKYLSRFTPSLMPPETLEAIFIKRKEQATRIVNLIRESITGQAKHHILLVGPRGIGKTHLTSIIYHRIKAMSDIGDKFKIAWLREEEWGISSLLDLFMRILNCLLEEHNDESLRRQIESLYNEKQNQAEISAGNLIKEYIGDNTLLLITENLDELFHGLGGKGQQKFRAYLQQNPFCCILATSPSLFSGISLQNSPFYGFFSINHLRNLNPDEAVELLIKIAKYRNDLELASFLDSPIGRARIRAVHHLAGGNPRIYIIFSQVITRESLDQLVEPFMQTIDDLTPYYQSRMTMLTPQQRKIIDLLCDKRHAVPVKEIARRCFITHQTTSGQLKKLREMRYVQAEEVGRESYYELSEPLMRICLEVKKQRGGPIRLFVDFLRLWYTRPQLENLLNTVQSEVGIEREYVTRALQLYDKDASDPHVTACIDDYLNFARKYDWTNALRAIDDLIEIQGDNKPAQAWVWESKTYLLALLGKPEEALSACEMWASLIPDNNMPLLTAGRIYFELHNYQEARELLEKFIDKEGHSPEATFLHAFCFFGLHKIEEGIRHMEKAWTLFPIEDRSIQNPPLFLLLQIAFNIPPNSHYYRPTIRAIAQLLSKHEMLLHLVASFYMLIIKELLPPLKSIETAKAWSEEWQQITDEHEEIQFALRIFNIAIRYRENHDPRILLELAAEERNLFKVILEEYEKDASFHTRALGFHHHS